MSHEQRIAAFSFRTLSGASGNVVPLRNPQYRAVISEPSRKWRDEVVIKLNELVALPIGWDGYRAQPVSFATAEFSLRMLEAICDDDSPTAQIVPGSNGDLQIEWHTPSMSVELHVRAPNSVFAWHSGTAETPEQELPLSTDFTVVVGWLRSNVRGERAAGIAAA